MNAELQHLDLIDSISERHVQLRRITEKLWNDNSEVSISNSEWFIMARIYKKQPTISAVSKNVDISRQATHKFIRSLESKGLVEIKNVENNKKEKCIELTAFGEDCYVKNETLKAELERKIADQIGAEQVTLLKEILKLDWGL
ncbi:MarR family transcriptional regulator [Bacillus sp. AFS076308]|uniref:MarR family winged helix-turn-helix transcriptional regulator n=1 Tax=unclassified Bacillus (in: firmicutes) TaxID=185979 RepID=UPI000BF2E765|nr:MULTISPECIES: MarR family winged helix-turn-helix transcriptional regulator [unclassified Bacillus (in: firmicutes)]PFO06699.1 MarR family transcriptional regulator [Bacillus sp. AFS076308]PGV52748.1 MarR family transcriptional regulator [Bacillus sp. AFS037270]